MAGEGSRTVVGEKLCTIVLEVGFYETELRAAVRTHAAAKEMALHYHRRRMAAVTSSHCRSLTTICSVDWEKIVLNIALRMSPKPNF